MAKSLRNPSIRPRLQDVAATAKVASSTCSAILSNSPSCYASQETRERVFKAAEQLQYYPNRFASSLRTNRTMQIGLITPRVFCADPVADEKFEPLETLAMERGYRVLVNSHYYDPSRELDYMRSMLADRVDGFMLYTNATDNGEFIRTMLREGIPLMTIESPFAFATPNVRVRRESGTYQQVMHMWQDAGRRKLAFMVSGTLGVEGKAKLAGYHKALAELGSDMSEHIYIDGTQAEHIRDTSLQQGLVLGREVLSGQRDIDGVILSSDGFALGLMQALHEKGLRVPDDVAVIGFDDQDIASVLPVPLTTIRQPREVGVSAFELLMRLIDNGLPKRADEYEQIELDPTLVVRQSTGAFK